MGQKDMNKKELLKKRKQSLKFHKERLKMLNDNHELNINRIYNTKRYIKELKQGIKELETNPSIFEKMENYKSEIAENQRKEAEMRASVYQHNRLEEEEWG